MDNITAVLIQEADMQVVPVGIRGHCKTENIPCKVGMVRFRIILDDVDEDNLIDFVTLGQVVVLLVPYFSVLD